MCWRCGQCNTAAVRCALLLLLYSGSPREASPRLPAKIYQEPNAHFHQRFSTFTAGSCHSAGRITGINNNNPLLMTAWAHCKSSRCGRSPAQCQISTSDAAHPHTTGCSARHMPCPERPLSLLPSLHPLKMQQPFIHTLLCMTTRGQHMDTHQRRAVPQVCQVIGVVLLCTATEWTLPLTGTPFQHILCELCTKTSELSTSRITAPWCIQSSQPCIRLLI